VLCAKSLRRSRSVACETTLLRVPFA
jgi:hypothetical protein